jgi:tetratricopeptide (TPR) repeat protein
MDIYARAETLYRSTTNPDAPEEAIDLLLQNALSHPHDPITWFALACCYDHLGRVQEALPYYERTSNVGVDKLPLTDRPRLFLQWGSTLRNLKRYQESEDILMQGARLFPEIKAIKAFLALTQYAKGDFQKAAQALFVILHSKYPEDSSLASYARTLDWYIDHLDVDTV